MNFYSHCHFKEIVYMLMNKAFDDTFSPHKRFFTILRKWKLAFFTRVGGRMYAQSEKQRTGKPPAACLGLPEAPLRATPCPFCSPEGPRAGGGSRGPLLPKRHLPGSFSFPNTIHRGWSDSSQDIKYTFQMPYVPTIERFLLHSSLFTKTWLDM